MTHFAKGQLVVFKNNLMNRDSKYRGMLTPGKRYTVEHVTYQGRQTFLVVMGDQRGRYVAALVERFEAVNVSYGTKLQVIAERKRRKEADAARKAAAKAKRLQREKEEQQRRAVELQRKAIEDYARRFGRPPPAGSMAEVVRRLRDAQLAAVPKMTAPYGKSPAPPKPLLFTEVTEEDIMTAVANYIRPKFGFPLKVVDLDKTTEGFKITLQAA